jgi:hypothetical protein
VRISGKRIEDEIFALRPARRASHFFSRSGAGSIPSSARMLSTVIRARHDHPIDVDRTLTIEALWQRAHSPRSAPPLIRSLFLGPRFRSLLPPHD